MEGRGGEGVSMCVVVVGGPRGRRWGGKRERGVFVSERHTGDSYARMKVDPPKRVFFVKAHLSDY